MNKLHELPDFSTKMEAETHETPYFHDARSYKLTDGQPVMQGWLISLLPKIRSNISSNDQPWCRTAMRRYFNIQSERVQRNHVITMGWFDVTTANRWRAIGSGYTSMAGFDSDSCVHTPNRQWSLQVKITSAMPRSSYFKTAKPQRNKKHQN